MQFISAKDAASLWNISQRRVSVLCLEGRIYGVERVGNMWLIPKDAKKPEDARTFRFENQYSLVKPFLKWAGGKAQILNDIRAKYPKGLGKTIKKYAEPFVGGGAVLFDILSNYEIDEIYISDINEELIFTYKTIRDNPDELILLLDKFEKEYINADEAERQEIYYSKREKFNNIKLQSLWNTELAALFIFLNKTCFNGLYRVNRKGEFNVPQGRYKSPLICDRSNLKTVSDKLKEVNIVCADYRKSIDFIDDDTFVYIDPPYRPLNASSNFTAYSQEGFDDNAQIELADFIDKLSVKGAKIVASNSDPKNINPNDDFFDELYKRHNLKRIYASRMINSVGNSRGKISELLISNY